jgi:hypothetical protein
MVIDVQEIDALELRMKKLAKGEMDVDKVQ